jgi:hypothetical protein
LNKNVTVRPFAVKQVASVNLGRGDRAEGGVRVRAVCEVQIQGGVRGGILNAETLSDMISEYLNWFPPDKMGQVTSGPISKLSWILV